MKFNFKKIFISLSIILVNLLVYLRYSSYLITQFINMKTIDSIDANSFEYNRVPEQLLINSVVILISIIVLHLSLLNSNKCNRVVYAGLFIVGIVLIINLFNSGSGFLSGLEYLFFAIFTLIIAVAYKFLTYIVR